MLKKKLEIRIKDLARVYMHASAYVCVRASDALAWRITTPSGGSRGLGSPTIRDMHIVLVRLDNRGSKLKFEYGPI